MGKAATRAVAKYKKNHYDRIEFTVKKGERERISNFIEEKNGEKTTTNYIRRALYKQLVADGYELVVDEYKTE